MEELLDLIDQAYPFIACDSPLSELHEKMYRALVKAGRLARNERLEINFDLARSREERS